MSDEFIQGKTKLGTAKITAKSNFFTLNMCGHFLNMLQLIESTSDNFFYFRFYTLYCHIYLSIYSVPGTKSSCPSYIPWYITAISVVYFTDTLSYYPTVPTYIKLSGVSRLSHNLPPELSRRSQITSYLVYGSQLKVNLIS